VPKIINIVPDLLELFEHMTGVRNFLRHSIHVLSYHFWCAERGKDKLMHSVLVWYLVLVNLLCNLICGCSIL